MDYHLIYSELKTKFPDLEIYEQHPLATYTTLNIGGPADIFIHTKTSTEFINILKFVSKLAGEGNIFFERSESEERSDEPVGSEAQKKLLPNQLGITIIGNGSNVLISDSGIRGIVIKNSNNSIEVIDTSPIPINFHHSYTQRQENEPDQYLDFTKLDYDESDKPQVLVKLSSGTSLPVAINHLIDRGITGLQWFAYIPGTIGGATWYNIHGGAYHFADYIESVEVFNLKTSKIENYYKREVDNFSERSERSDSLSEPEGSEHCKNSSTSKLSFSYETSPFQQHPEWIILSTTLRLFKGDAKLAKQVATAWIIQKLKVQPMNSAGSTFANPPLEACLPIWGEQKSTGWIIDHELGWKGHRVGDAQISLQHSNFIVNLGSATAHDYLTLLTDIQKEVKKRFDLKLLPEVKLLGGF